MLWFCFFGVDLLCSWWPLLLEQTRGFGDKGVQRGDRGHQGCSARKRDARKNANAVVEGFHGRFDETRPSGLWCITRSSGSSEIRSNPNSEYNTHVLLDPFLFSCIVWDKDGGSTYRRSVLPHRRRK